MSELAVEKLKAKAGALRDENNQSLRKVKVRAPKGGFKSF
jgi:hypothetical protein